MRTLFILPLTGHKEGSKELMGVRFRPMPTRPVFTKCGKPVGLQAVLFSRDCGWGPNKAYIGLVSLSVVFIILHEKAANLFYRIHAFVIVVHPA